MSVFFWVDELEADGGLSGDERGQYAAHPGCFRGFAWASTDGLGRGGFWTSRRAKCVVCWVSCVTVAAARSRIGCVAERRTAGSLRHDLKVSGETLRRWMMEAGLWLSRKQRRKFHQPRCDVNPWVN
jgi:hypothetical protein